jgi:type II secretory pathway pseudopilin PulG
MMAMGLMAAAQQLPPGTPPEVQQLFEAPNLISAAELTFNLSATGPMSLVVHANDDAAAERLEQLMDTGMKVYQEQMKAQMAQQAASQDPVEQAMAKYMERVTAQWATAFRPTREGSQLTFFRTDGSDPAKQQYTQIAVIGILVALLLPAIQAAREAARRTQAANGMRNLILAMMMYQDAHKTLPAHAIYSADGKPLLSWRVQILPYIEQEALYKKFKLDEPWDSEHNRALVAQMPAVFANPNVPEPGKTNYLAVVGESCGFNGTKDGLGLKDFTDGTSNTIMLVEANADRAVEWTKPEDWQYDANNPTAGLGKLRPAIFQAAFADGSVRNIANTIDPEALKALFTRNGREPNPPLQ